MRLMTLPKGGKIFRTIGLLPVTICFLYGGNTLASVSAQEIEETLVTAQKRSERISDVPISLSLTTGEYLSDMSIYRMEELTGYATNIHLTETGLSTQVRIRGFGSGNNQGFEQSVGAYNDGVYYGRAQLLRAPFLDLARVEILRGPQNALFGKNSIAGAIAVYSAPATEQFEYSLYSSYVPDSKERLINGFVSGAITKNLNGRFAFRDLNSDGDIKNTTKGLDDPRREERAFRLLLDWQALESLDVSLKVEQNDFDVRGRTFEVIQDLASPATLDLILGQPGNQTLLDTPSTYANISSALGEPSFEARRNFKRQTSVDELSENETYNYTVNVKFESDAFLWSSTLAAVGYSFDELCDCDYVPANVFTLSLNEDYDQISFDTHLLSANSDGYSWIAGLYFQKYDHDFYDDFDIPVDSMFATLGSPVAGSGVGREFEQESEVISIYGQWSMEFASDYEFIVEGRYSEEKKSASKSLTILDANNDASQSVGLACAYLVGLGVVSVQSEGLPNDCASSNPDAALGLSPGHDVAGSRNESVFTPSVTLKYKFSENKNIFFSAKRGYKSGGFDVRSNSPDSFEFDAEDSRSLEFGYRTVGDSYESGVTVFHTVIDDMQFSQYDGAVGFNVGNARETVSRGVELDGRWVYSNLSLQYALGYQDVEHTNFSNGNCYQGQAPDGDDISGDGLADLCDYTGKQSAFTPKLTANLGVMYDVKITEAVALFSSVNVQHIGSHNVHPNLDPNGRQDSYQLVNAYVGVGAENWRVSIFAKNLGDEHVLTYAANVPLSGSTFGTNTLYGYARQGRTVGLSLKYSH